MNLPRDGSHLGLEGTSCDFGQYLRCLNVDIQGQLTSGSSLGSRLARKLSRVTASVPLKDATRLPMVLSILDLSPLLSGVAVMAVSHA